MRDIWVIRVIIRVSRGYLSLYIYLSIYLSIELARSCTVTKQAFHKTLSNNPNSPNSPSQT